VSERKGGGGRGGGEGVYWFEGLGGGGGGGVWGGGGGGGGGGGPSNQFTGPSDKKVSLMAQGWRRSRYFAPNVADNAAASLQNYGKMGNHTFCSFQSVLFKSWEGACSLPDLSVNRVLGKLPALTQKNVAHEVVL